MREFWHRFCTRPRWFIGTIVALGILVLFFWFLIDRQDFIETINAFIQVILKAVYYLLVIAIMALGVMVMFGYRPFKSKGKSNNGH